jgi:alpha-galactosidase
MFEIRTSYAAIIITIAVCATAPCQQHSQSSWPLTPPMGWNSWNHFGKNVTEEDIRAAADALVASGMRDAGYIYVNLDGSWEGDRDSNGMLHVNPAKFNDMKNLADYIHSKGLKFGIYSSPGPVTCGGFTASYQHEEQDARMFAEWGVDFLKYDLCSYRPFITGQGLEKERELDIAVYEKMHRALIKTGRPIIYSLCQYGLDNVWEWGFQVGATMWRTTDDVKDNYQWMSNYGFSQAGLSKYVSPGHWNDPDMLQIGNGGMNADEYRTQMSLWAIVAAPLLAGNDLTQMDDITRSILLNKEIIAVDQDPLGRAGDRVWATGPFELWARPLQDGAIAVGLFNRLGGPAQMTFKLSDIGWTGPALARNLWTHQDLGSIGGSFTTTVPRHGVVLLLLKKPVDAYVNAH